MENKKAELLRKQTFNKCAHILLIAKMEDILYEWMK